MPGRRAEAGHGESSACGAIPTGVAFTRRSGASPARADERLYLEKQVFKSRIRRRRALISGIAVALVGAVVLAVFLSLPRSPEKVPDPPPSASVTTSTVILPASSDDEALLLARITELQAEIARLTQERKGQRPPETGERIAEIA